MFVMQSRQIKNGLTGYEESFNTAFNYSNIFATAYKDGESLISVSVAIEYP